MRMLKLPDERIKILVQGVAKGKVDQYIQTEPYYSVRIEKVVEAKLSLPSLEAEAVMRSVKEQIERIVSLGKVLMPDVMVDELVQTLTIAVIGSVGYLAAIFIKIFSKPSFNTSLICTSWIGLRVENFPMTPTYRIPLDFSC